MILGWMDNKMKQWFSGRKTGKPIRSLSNQSGKGESSFHSVLNLLCSCLCHFKAAAVGMTMLSVIFTVSAAPVWADPAANTQIINRARLSCLYDGTTITADGSVTVTPNISAQAGFAKYVRNVTTNAAGTGTPYAYNSVNYYPSGVTAKPGEILEYLLVSTNSSGTISAAVVTDVLPTGYISLKTGVYSGGTKDIIYVDDAGTVSYLTAAASDDAASYSAPTLTVNVGTGATSSAGGTIPTGKSVLVLYQVHVNNLASLDKIVNSARLSSADITPATASVTVIANIGLANFAKYVRNVTVPGGSGTSYSYGGNNYYLTGITVKPGDILEYIIVSTNIGTGTISASVVTDSLPTSYVSLKTGGYSGETDITYVNEYGIISYLTAAGDTDPAIYAAPTLTVNVGTGATSLTGGTIPAGKKVLVLYQVTINNAVQADKIVNSAKLDSPDITSTPTSAVTVTAVIRTNSVIEFLIYAPLLAGADLVKVSTTAYRSGSSATDSFVNMPAPIPVGTTTPIDLSRPVPLTPTTQIHEGEPVFIRVTDLDQNLDKTVAETVLVTVNNPANGDVVVLRLTETGLNTGVFAGYLPTKNVSATPYNGIISVNAGDTISAHYVDIVDGSDTSTDAVMVDPYGIVLDTSTGLPVDGATITIINKDTGQPAKVFGDDGVSTFPATIISGGSATDSNGVVYSFPKGGYRFPFVLPGNYQYEITPPPGYGFPSTVETATIQALPGGPFTIVTGSRGETFVLNPGPSMRIDIPLDPGVAALWLLKSANKNAAGHGDFISYLLTLTNNSKNIAASGIHVVDTMPVGFRLRKGSVKVNSVSAADPTISADGRTLTFNAGDLQAGFSITISYVAEVTAGTRIGEAINTAIATTAIGEKSNRAHVKVVIKDDFMRTRSTLMGRVSTGDCNEETGEGPGGVEGVRVYLEDGTFVISDKRGLFHFEGVRAGLHVVQLDLDSLPDGYEAFACNENSRFAGRSFSQFVETKGGALLRTDFHVRKKQAAEKPVVVNPPADPLPIEPEKKTEVTPTPEVSSKPEVSRMPEIILRPHFPVRSAELNAEDRKKLDELAGSLAGLNTEEIHVIGHTDNMRIAPQNRIYYSDNYALSLARAKSVGNYLMEKLNIPPEKMFVEGKGSDQPIADNKTQAGRALNRRVEVRITTSKVVHPPKPAVIAVQKTDKEPPIPGSTVVAVSAPEVPAGVKAPVQPNAVSPEVPTAPAQTKSATPEVKTASAKEKSEEITIKDNEGILSPGDKDVLVNSINGIRICLASGLTPRLLLDDKEVPADRIGFTMKDAKAGKTIYSYIGVDFGKRGDHVVQLQGMDPFGNARFKQTISVKRSGEIVSIRLKSAEGNVADGKTPVKMRMELYDDEGTLIPAGAELEIREGKLKSLKKPDVFAATPTAGSHPRVQMSKEGDVLFEPVNNSGLYTVVLGYNKATIEAETYVQPQLRDWILVGLGEGTVGYNTVSGNMENLQHADMDDKLYQDNRVALFAKGQIKGKWLLTMAYDSAKTKGMTRTDGLFQTVNPETYYTLYGDASTQQYDAASAKNLYLKIERDQFYAMFGDFDTGMTVTELSLYSRRMTGVKTELQNKNFEVNAFASETDQVYARDEIPGDGTSGIYRLSRKNIVPNSDKITIEVRDRFHSEKLISSRVLTSFTDYSIDYDAGTVIFKEPIYNRDEQFNPIIIVAEYETLSSGGQDYTYGGRAGVKLLNQRLKAGANYIHEGQGDQSGNLYGVDASFKLNEETKVRAEVATSDVAAGAYSHSGNAYLAEVLRTTKHYDAKAYFREQGEGFGLGAGFGQGQQPVSEGGMRKYGVEGAYRFSDIIKANADIYRQDNLLTHATRDVAEGKLNYASKAYSAYVGFLHANDNLVDGSSHESNQLTLGGKVPTLYKRLSLTMDYAQSIGSNDNTDFPTRVILGAEYKATQKVTLMAAQEFTWGSAANTQGTRLGMRSGLWKGADLTSSVERQFTENDDRVFANVGLKQTWTINDAWKMDAGLERSQTIANSERYEFNSNVQPASGTSGNNENFTSVSGGATYQIKHMTWENRLEFRLADSEDKWGLMSGIVKEIDSSWAWSGRAQVFQTSASTGLDTTKIDLRYGIVYRPPQTQWIVLDRLDFIIDEQSGGTGISSKSWRLINNFITNYRPRKDLQLSLHYGAKYVQETIDENDYSGFTDLIGVEGRYDINKDWDIGLHGSILHSWNSGQLDYCEGISIGYNVMQNAWISLGYNFTGFQDKDFSQAEYTAQGPFVRFRFKFDQNSVQDAAKWLGSH